MRLSRTRIRTRIRIRIRIRIPVPIRTRSRLRNGSGFEAASERNGFGRSLIRRAADPSSREIISSRELSSPHSFPDSSSPAFLANVKQVQIKATLAVTVTATATVTLSR